MTGLPTGTVTLVFTDIEGSTRLLHDLGDDYLAVLADHRRLLRAAFTEAGGREVDTQGDAFFVVFPRARDAVAAAIAAQRALLQHRWPNGASVRVRMGLHTGEPLSGGKGYVGIDVHRAARIGAAAWGGQVIVSQTTRELIAADLPEGLHLRDLGEHRLKDLGAPQHLYQIAADDLPSDFPPPRSLDALPNNLPVQLTSLVGRDRELIEIDRLLENPSCRLLTLIGPGGIGKTRLALHAAARRVEKHAQGVYFVPLSAVATPEFLAPTLAAILQLPIDTATSDKDPKAQLLDYLGRRSMLLVMDNFEHLVDGALLLDELLEGAREIKLIVTSRERLNLRGEWTFDVPGLSYPRNGDGAPIEDYGAISLFTERARQVDPAFSLSDQERTHATRICRLVDGMPLAIELAAAWASTLSCREIAEAIERNVDFLATSMRDVPDRHRSLRAAFEHSWRLLSEPQQTGFRRLSVFRGGFQREAASTVAGLDLSMLAELVNKSLVRRSAEGRYGIHELLAQYAAEKLSAFPEEEEAVRGRHSRYYTTFLADRAESIRGARLKEVREEIRTELGNVGTAVQWLAAHGSETDVRSTFASLHAFYRGQGWHEGADAFRRIAETLRSMTEMEGEADGNRAGLMASAQAYQAFLSSAAGDTAESDGLVQLCLPTLRRLGYAREVAACLSALGVNASNRGEYAESVKYLEEVLALMERSPDYFITTWSHTWLGWAHFELGNYGEAERHYQASGDLSRSRGDKLALAFTLDKLGILADALKQYQRAAQLHQDALSVFVEMESKAGEAYSLTRRSFSNWGLGNYEEAARLGRAGYEAFESLGHPWGMTRALCVIGFAELGMDRPREAHASFSRALERSLEHHLVSNALYALIGLASVLSGKGEGTLAVEILAFCIDHRFTPALFRDIAAREFADLESRVPSEIFTEARTRGQRSTLEQIVETVTSGRVRR